MARAQNVLLTVGRRLAVWMLLPALGGCGAPASPSRPSVLVSRVVDRQSFEAEDGDGDGYLLQRSAASGSHTIHLAPGERRRWSFRVTAAETQFALSIRYSNSRWGDLEILSLAVDGVRVSTFLDRDTGESTEGWNTFVIDPAGTTTLRAGDHTLVLESSGGDGCVEIDIVTLRADGVDG